MKLCTRFVDAVTKLPPDDQHDYFEALNKLASRAKSSRNDKRKRKMIPTDANNGESGAVAALPAAAVDAPGAAPGAVALPTTAAPTIPLAPATVAVEGPVINNQNGGDSGQTGGHII